MTDARAATATTIVLLPGFMQDARIFAPQIDSLSHSYAVLVVPTHLDKSVEDIAERVLDAAPKKFALFGLSLGGAVALEIAKNHSDRLVRLCLSSSTAMSDTPDVAAQRDVQMAGVKGGRFEDLLQAALNLDGLADTPYKREIAAMGLDMAKALGADAFLNQAYALQRRKEYQSTLRQIQCPTLILGGEDDPIHSPKRHEFMAEMVPNATLKLLPNASHFLTLEQPVAVNTAIRDWLG